MKSFLQILFVILLISQLTFPQWINQNPVPDGNGLWSTFFVDDNTGWIVGTDGFIIKTTNAGVDWIEQTSGTTLILKSVQFVNLNTGWICGESGLIIKTTDGGSSWDSLTSVTTEHLTDIHFSDVDTGYVVGYGGTILKTTDGGSVWTSLSSGTTVRLYSVDFVDALVGYVVGGESQPYAMLKTTDGGTSWIDKSSGLNVSYYLLAVDFIDANTGFVGGGQGPSDMYIVKTTDGGDTWTGVFSKLDLERKEQNHREQLRIYDLGGINSIYFKDSNIGYVVSGDDHFTREINITTDGGSTWIQKHFGDYNMALYSIYGNNTGQGWAVGHGGVIFITEDDGNSWAQILSGKRVNYASGDDIHSVFFINENIGWAVGNRESGAGAGPIILKTTNGGKIWKTKLHLPINVWTELTSVYFINENIGWAAGESFLRTTDGGENWNEEGGIHYASSVFFINQDTGWVTTDNYSIWPGIHKSTDGGITWVEKSSISSSSVYFTDANNGWTVGAAGSILKSTDGGETWVTKISGTTSDLNCVKFYDLNLGMCVGDAGRVLLSTDGGESWIPQDVGTAETLTAFDFTNSVTVWIAGYNGTILNTTDLGYNWVSYDEVTTNDLTSLSFINEYTGWVGGDNDIYKYLTEPPSPPTWSNQISVEDAGGTESSEILTFGQHVDATDSIDASLGEYELPPPPFTGNFDARLNLPTNPQVSSLIDFRDSTQTEITWTLQFQSGIAGYPITFSWDSTSFSEGTFYLKDRIDGSYVFVNMKNQSSYALTEPTITSFNISYKGNCLIVSVNNYWNMLSVPVLAEDMKLSNLFPTATSSAYGYDDGYVEENTLATGKGYWLKFDGNEDIQICGALLGDTVQVNEGWNMFGVYEEDILGSQLTTTPPNIIATYFFGFEDGYFIADTLKSGKGYWVRVTEDGVINLDSGSLAKDGEKEQIAKVGQDWGKIRITDNEGKNITLYAAEKEIESSFYELPPMPPSGVFDARYISGRIVEDISSEKIIQVSSDNYPITIRAEGISITVRDRINGELLNEELKNGEELIITNNKITSIEIIGRITGGLPISYELFQNYPNPFNPSTTIKFAVPKESNVNLTVYNVLGELVSTLVNEQMKPGYYEYKFDATNFASGVYFYRLQAGSFVETKKMVLLR